MVKLLIKFLKPTEGRIKSCGIELLQNGIASGATNTIYFGQVKILGCYWTFNVYIKKTDARNAVNDIIKMSTITRV